MALGLLLALASFEHGDGDEGGRFTGVLGDIGHGEDVVDGQATTEVDVGHVVAEVFADGSKLTLDGSAPVDLGVVVQPVAVEVHSGHSTHVGFEPLEDGQVSALPAQDHSPVERDLQGYAQVDHRQPRSEPGQLFAGGVALVGTSLRRLSHQALQVPPL